MWELGIKPGSSANAANVLYHGAISPGSIFCTEAGSFTGKPQYPPAPASPPLELQARATGSIFYVGAGSSHVLSKHAAY